MKKNHQKALAVVLLLGLGFYAYKTFGNPFAKKSKLSLSSDVPKEFETKTDINGNFTKYWFDGKDYYMQPIGPTVKAIAVKIDKKEFENQYAN